MTMSVYRSLEQLRADKEEAKRSLDLGAKKLKNDVDDLVRPRDSFFFNSTNKYLQYIGYAVSAYKGYMTFKGIFKGFGRK